jgi:pimeloyl-ACP methyl ester carboxylesterase
MKRNQLLIVLTLITELSFGQAVSLDSSYPAPGRLIDIGGRKMHLHCTGKGTPTIILVAGGGAFSIDWTLVQESVDSNCRVCSYDRAGLGWSDSGPADETVEQTVGDLHKLLQAAGEKEPFILVGASIGGIFIQAYQHEYPKEVAGLVFSNSSNRVGLRTSTKTDLIWYLSVDEVKSVYPSPASYKGNSPDKVEEPFDRLPAKLQKERLWLSIQLWKQYEPSKAGPESMLSWRKEFMREFDQTDAGKKPPLGKLPVIVLSGDPAANDSVLKSRDAAGGWLDFLSSNTLHITLPDVGHEIHLYQPDQVVQALRRILFAVRNGTPM